MRFRNALLGALGACAFGTDLSISQPHSHGTDFSGECSQEECGSETDLDVQSFLEMPVRLHTLARNGVLGHPRHKAAKVAAKQTLHQGAENNQTEEVNSLAQEQQRNQTLEASRQIHLERTGGSEASIDTTNETANETDSETENEAENEAENDSNNQTSVTLQSNQDRCGTASCELKFGTAGEAEKNFRQLTKKPAMRFTKVCTQGGQPLDLRMSAASSYHASNDANNGVAGNFGRINIRLGSSLKVKFEFFKAGTNTKVQVDSVIFSIVDLDSSDGTETKVYAGGYSQYVLSKLSTLKTTMTNGVLHILATEKHLGNTGQPSRPNHMTEEQQRRAIALKFSSVKEFFITFEVKSKAMNGGHDFLFAGRSDACLQQPRIDHGGADVKHYQKVEKQPVVNIDGKFTDKAQLRKIMTSSPTPADWVWWNAADAGVMGMAATENNQKDVPHWKAILRSKPFRVTPQTTIAVTLNGGMGAKRSINGQKAELTGVTDQQGFLGVAIQDVEADKWVLSKTRTENNRNNERVVFSQAELKPYVGKPLTVDFIDSYSGPWGWITFKWLEISGTSSPAPTPRPPQDLPSTQSAQVVWDKRQCLDGPYIGMVGMQAIFTESPAGEESQWWSQKWFGFKPKPPKGQNGKHLKGIIRSRHFEVHHTTSIKIDTRGGVGAAESVVGQAAKFNGETDENGFLGIAIVDAITGKWILSKRRSKPGDFQETIGFSPSELAPFNGKTVALDLIDSYSGWDGFLMFKDLVMDGTCNLQLPTPPPTPPIPPPPPVQPQCMTGFFKDEKDLKSNMFPVTEEKHGSWWGWHGFNKGLSATKWEKRDLEHPQIIMRSKPFLINEGTSISVITEGGRGSVTDVIGVPAVTSGTAKRNGFLGMALQDVSTGKWVKSKRRTNIGNFDETLVFDTGELRSLVNKVVTLDFVDSYAGAWGWISFRNLYIGGPCQFGLVNPPPGPGPSPPGPGPSPLAPGPAPQQVPTPVNIDGNYNPPAIPPLMTSTPSGGAWKWRSASGAAGFAPTSTEPNQRGGTHQPSIWRSKATQLTAQTEIRVETRGGTGSAASVTGQSPKNGIPSGYVGIAIRDAAGNKWIVSKRRKVSSNNLETITFTPAELAQFAGKVVTIDVIDNASGPNGWIAVTKIDIKHTAPRNPNSPSGPAPPAPLPVPPPPPPPPQTQTTTQAPSPAPPPRPSGPVPTFPPTEAGNCGGKVTCELSFHNLVDKRFDANFNPPTMRYADVCASSGKKVDLLIRGTSDYKPYKSSINYDVNGLIGKLNVKDGTTATVTFSLVQSGTETPVVTDSLYFTVLYMHGWIGRKEVVEISGHTDMKTHPTPELKVEKVGGTTKITSTGLGSVHDAPVNPWKLDETQKKRTVAFEFRKVSKWQVKFTAQASYFTGSSTFFFSGSSNILNNCPKPR